MNGGSSFKVQCTYTDTYGQYCLDPKRKLQRAKHVGMISLKK